MDAGIKSIRVAGAAIGLLFFLMSSGCVAPGEGGKARLGREEGDRIVEALANYHAKYGGYPDQLEALVPDLLKAAPMMDHNNAEQVQFFYIKTSDGQYRLIFKYVGPGTNECNHYPSYPDGSWKCVGAY